MSLLVIPLLFALCFGGLAWLLLVALREGLASYGQVYAVDTAREFEDVFLFIPPQRLLDLSRAAALSAFLLVFLLCGELGSYAGMLRGAVCGGAMALLALNSPRLILRLIKRRRLARFNQQLVDGLLNMSNALKAGFSILQAFEAVVKARRNPIAQEFGVFLQQVRVGVRFEDALRQMDDRIGSEDLTLMILAIETARQTGGNLTEVFEKIAATIRERMRIQGRIRSLTAQGRLQGLVVGSMPLLLLVAMSWMDPQMMNGFFRSPPGWLVLGLVLFLEVVGALLIRRIMDIKV